MAYAFNWLLAQLGYRGRDPEDPCARARREEREECARVLDKMAYQMLRTDFERTLLREAAAKIRSRK
jgi:hypothetical protein